MPKRQFLVRVTSIRKIYDMPGTWSDSDYRDLLGRLEVEGLEQASGSDLFEMMLMALQDMEPDAAADAVLAFKLGDDLSRGARQNLAQDLLEGQRSWEDAADIRLHARIFAAAVLLQKAWPKTFSKPDMMQLVLNVSARTPEARKLLSQPPQPAFVTRMLADAMDSHSILERLFDEQLAAQHFVEAEAIIWLAESDRDGCTDEDSVNLTIYSSEHWLESMRSISEFESSAYNDARVRETEHD